MRTTLAFYIEGESIAESSARKKLVYEEAPVLAAVGDLVHLPALPQKGQLAGTLLSRTFLYDKDSVLIIYTLQKRESVFD